jgi:hypothetical protein
MPLLLIPPPSTPLIYTCPVSDTGEANAPYLIRRQGTGAPDGRGGYVDAVDDLIDFCGRQRRIKRNLDPTKTPDQGTTGIVPVFLLTDRTNLDVRESDVIAEARDDGSGSGTLEEVPGGRKYRVRQVRIYDDDMQIDVDYLAKDQN